MPYNGSGVFSRLYSWVTDAANSLPISPSRMDTDSNDIASALNNVLTRDAQGKPSQNFNVNGFNVINMASATVSGQALAFQQLFSQGNPAIVASAATVDIGGQSSVAVEVSGTTTVTSFGTNYNGPRWVRFQSSLLLTYNGTTLNLPGGANITTQAGDVLVAYPNSSLNGWNVVIYQPYSVNTGSVVGSARNLRANITVASATATFTADEIAVQTALGGSAIKIGSLNKTINLATTGAGGMDTGSAPVSGYVAVYAIYNPSTATSALLATNATSAAQANIYGGANMPSGYTASALISVWPTNASSQFVAGLQRDRKVSIVGVTVLISGSNQASYASLSISVAAPKNALAVSGSINVTSTSSTFCTGAVTPDGTSDIQQIAASNVVQILAPFRDLPILTAQTLYYAAFVNAGTPSISVVVCGYTF